MYYRLGRGKGWSAAEIFLIERRLKVRIQGISQTQVGLLPSLRASFSCGKKRAREKHYDRRAWQCYLLQGGQEAVSEEKKKKGSNTQQGSVVQSPCFSGSSHMHTCEWLSVCACRVHHLLPAEARRGCWTPWNWRSSGEPCRFWELNRF